MGSLRKGNYFDYQKSNHALYFAPDCIFERAYRLFKQGNKGYEASKYLDLKSSVMADSVHIPLGAVFNAHTLAENTLRRLVFNP